MRAHSLIGTVLASLLLSGIFLAMNPQPAPALEVGDAFPEIVLPSLDGEPMSNASFRGTKVAMHVWAAW